jgi:hypothetical protein
VDTFHEKYHKKPGPLSNWLYNITLLELSPNRGILSQPNISKSMIYNFMIKAAYEITVHYGFKYCSLIADYS